MRFVQHRYRPVRGRPQNSPLGVWLYEKMGLIVCGTGIAGRQIPVYRDVTAEYPAELPIRARGRIRGYFQAFSTLSARE